jgi:single-stranded DNA-binding protein
MSYLDAAVSGTVIVEPQLKQSAKGNAYARFLMVVGSDDAKQFVWVCIFGEDAERVAPLLKKSAKAYVEGTLSSEVYQRDGKPTVSLSIAARRVEILGQIGRNRPRADRPRQDAEARRSQPMQRDGYPFDDAPFDEAMT